MLRRGRGRGRGPGSVRDFGRNRRDGHTAAAAAAAAAAAGGGAGVVGGASVHFCTVRRRSTSRTSIPVVVSGHSPGIFFFVQCRCISTTVFHHMSVFPRVFFAFAALDGATVPT